MDHLKQITTCFSHETNHLLFTVPQPPCTYYSIICDDKINICFQGYCELFIRDINILTTNKSTTSLLLLLISIICVHSLIFNAETLIHSVITPNFISS